MPSVQTHFKLGLFAVVALSAVVASAFVLGFMASHRAAIGFETYFDESVEGLEIGAPVKYRGVRIGNVSTIAVAPDRRFVAVGLALAERDVRRLRLETPAPDLRAELATQGITGVKFIDLDFVDRNTSPPPTLAFVPAPHYLPSRPSLLARLGVSTEALRRDATDVLRGATATLHRVDTILDDIDAQHLPARVGELIDHGRGAIADGRGAIADVRRLVTHVDRAGVPEHANAALDRVAAAATGVDRTLDRIGGDDGLVTAAKHAVTAIDDVARGTLGSTDELERTIHDLGDAARVFRDFVDELERDPDMLVKGRARTKGP